MAEISWECGIVRVEGWVAFFTKALHRALGTSQNTEALCHIWHFLGVTALCYSFGPFWRHSRFMLCGWAVVQGFLTASEL